MQEFHVDRLSECNDIEKCAGLISMSYNRLHTRFVIHIYTENAVMVTKQWTSDRFSMSGLVMIKEIFNTNVNKYMEKDDELTVLIVEDIRDLDGIVDSLKKIGVPAVLVRDHGVFVWSQFADIAIEQSKALDFIFGIALKLKK